VSEQRLERLSLWLALSVAWFAAHVLARLAPEAAARIVDEYARHARLLLVARALRRAPLRRLPGRAGVRRLTCRAVAGGALRRALNAGPHRRRVHEICAVLASPERWVARIVRRLRRGFTKRGGLPAPRRRLGASLLPPAPQTPRTINSS
jgi:hypothetical protein